MILGDKQNTYLVLNINVKKINNSRETELLGIVVDKQLIATLIISFNLDVCK